MSESLLHRRLVVDTSIAINRLYPDMQLTIDIIEKPGGPVPSMIGGYRPDIIGRSNGQGIHQVIAEAKIDGDVKRLHTICQIDAFIDYLESMKSANGTFILAVNGYVCGTARTILNLNYRHRVSDNIHIKLFDGLDFWCLGRSGETLWRLS
ncbi:MAG: hypothetical protein OXC57_03750 [Rhodobacteraceae bacterium]|nr:hypothetical protein [Paracoccaceae bacterium]